MLFWTYKIHEVDVTTQKQIPKRNVENFVQIKVSANDVYWSRIWVFEIY